MRSIARLSSALSAAAFAVALAASANAQAPSDPSTTRPPRARTQAAPTAGHAPPLCEQELAIAPLFSGESKWKGEVPVGALGPDSPATTSDGRASCRPIAEGHWYSCDISDRVGTGPEAVPWKGQMLVGYDRTENRYKATVADNMGSELMHLQGTLTGNKLVLETPQPVTGMGREEKQRISFDFTDPRNVGFLDERQVAGQPWRVFERATIRNEPRGQARTPPPQRP